MNQAELTGQVRSHIADITEPACVLHRETAAPFLSLRRAASAAGIDLVPQSSFRDFARQLLIWNGKFTGERPMHDAGGMLVDSAALTLNVRRSNSGSRLCARIIPAASPCEGR